MILASLLWLALSVARADAAPRSLDPGTDLRGWTAVSSEGVEARLSRDPDEPGSLRMDFDFKRGSGYAIARLDVDLPFAENFRYAMRIKARGENGEEPAPNNTLECKLVDKSNDSVWWVNRPHFEFPKQWTDLRFKRRQFWFAWGPHTGQPLNEVAHIEITVTAGTGGRGTLWIEGPTFEELPPEEPYSLTPRLEASSRVTMKGEEPRESSWDLGPSGEVDWRAATPKPGDRIPFPQLTVDFGKEREFGGLAVDWAEQARPAAYRVESSLDGACWATLFEQREPDHPAGSRRDVVRLPEASARYLRFVCERRGPGDAVAMDRLRVLPLEFGENENQVWRLLAKESARGWYPEYFLDAASYWTIAGVDGDHREALISRHGQVELFKSGPSLEVFNWCEGRLWTWADAAESPGGFECSLEDGYIPMPTAAWRAGPLRIAATVYGAEPASIGVTLDDTGKDPKVMLVRIVIRNQHTRTAEGTLFVALRPFQVNPPYQFLNTPGGAAPVHALEFSGRRAVADGRVFESLSEPSAAGATCLLGGDISEWLSRGETPPRRTVRDHAGRASGAFGFDYKLAPGEEREYWFVSPPSTLTNLEPLMPAENAALRVSNARELFARTRAAWEGRLNVAQMTPPKGAERWWDVARSQIGYILLNRDGPAIQPGSRSYERTWIRDGSLTCNALLDFGHAEEVRAFLDWFAPMQYDNGKVPCCADSRGPDPVPENDSHGQFIYAMATYAKYTGDLSLLRKHYERIVGAVKYMEFLRAQRLTPQYVDAPEGSLDRAKAGLMPESISHEGYSAKPMHSYWDDLFALRGFKDAAWIAGVTGHEDDARTFASLAEVFRASLLDSIRRSMAYHRIDYLPGCVELGDFDATSTTVALFPVDEAGLNNQGRLPLAAVEATFDRYWSFFVDRRDGATKTTWEAYTPYENRAIGALVRLGRRDRAHDLVRYFLDDQRPRGWNAFAEVVWRDPTRPSFIGDIPHTWCGSDYVNSFRSLFVYEREFDDALVLFHGVTREWLDSGFSFTNWQTVHGPLSAVVAPANGGFVIELSAAENAENKGNPTRPWSPPAGGLVLMLPESSRLSPVRIDGRETQVRDDGAIVVDHLPAKVECRWR